MKDDNQHYSRRQARKQQKKQTRVSFVLIFLTVVVGVFICYKVDMQGANQQKSASQQSSRVQLKTQTDKKVKQTYPTESAKQLAEPTWKKTKSEVPIDQWRLPSSVNGAYPRLTGMRALHVVVSLDKQRVYIMNGNEVVYTMICSTGDKNNPTPKGHFRIGERGQSFYNRKLGEGANYWVSFKNNVYLFHTVPTNANGQYKIGNAEKLGQPASHGCVHLSIPDARWFYNNIPARTPVTVE